MFRSSMLRPTLSTRLSLSSSRVFTSRAMTKIVFEGDMGKSYPPPMTVLKSHGLTRRIPSTKYIDPLLRDREKNERSYTRRTLFLGVVALFGASYFFTMRGSETHEQDQTWTEYCTIMRTLPLRMFSRAYGAVARLPLPPIMREPVCGWWTWAFDCNIQEMEKAYEEYESLSEFFSRKLKDGARPIDKNLLVSPVDARIVKIGQVSEGGKLEQIKDMHYDVEEFLGKMPKLYSSKNSLHYCVLYLAPGDYHRIHSATDWKVDSRLHIAGEMFPVHPFFYNFMPSLLTKNERVVLTGKWKHGFFSQSPVAAYNVGGMKLENLNGDQIQTNTDDGFYKVSNKGGYKYKKDLMTYKKPIKMEKGKEIGRFEMGSTVVLVFEAKKCEFLFKEGDKVQMGQQLAKV